jgi:hypothetical protein
MEETRMGQLSLRVQIYIHEDGTKLRRMGYTEGNREMADNFPSIL